MVWMRSIHRLLLHHFIFVCFLCTVFIFGYSLIYFLSDDQNQVFDFSEYDDKITFWSNDYHISPIHDLKNTLTPLGVRFIDESLSASCSTAKTCAKHLYILSTHNGMNPNQSIRKRFYEFYKDDPLMNHVDAFVCFHPAAMCELFMPFNRTIIVIASTRYELGRFAVDEWNQWNQNLRLIASDPRNVVAANNLYDAEYIRYFTGINTTVLPAICAYTNVHYRSVSTRPEFILFPSNSYVQFTKQFLDELNLSIKKAKTSIIVQPLRKLYPTYDYSDLVRHPGIIYLPYQVSTMSIFEQYTMNIPLFFPSIDLLTEWHLKYSLVYDRTWDKVLTGKGKSRSAIPPYDLNTTVPDPNNEFDHFSIYYWLKYADYYQWPYITYFESIDDLVSKLLETNLNYISEQMSIYNQRKRSKLLEDWQHILKRISTSSKFLMKKEKTQ
ncbi:unnamed protein product [Adineta ricciae]|uniref:Uncharacterized protein n=1 Tax=Adineta ricciae TaxID=249248 RepID=A0A814R156_ADIRI|nr:unnamed protein product [Adineta ricciae]